MFDSAVSVLQAGSCKWLGASISREPCKRVDKMKNKVADLAERAGLSSIAYDASINIIWSLQTLLASDVMLTELVIICATYSELSSRDTADMLPVFV